MESIAPADSNISILYLQYTTKYYLQYSYNLPTSTVYSSQLQEKGCVTTDSIYVLVQYIQYLTYCKVN